MKNQFLFYILFMIVMVGYSQTENKPKKATYFDISKPMQIMPSIASRVHLIPEKKKNKEEVKDGRSSIRASKNKIIIGKDPQTDNDALSSNPHRLSQKIQGRAPSITFDIDTPNATPTDPSLAVGPNHVVTVHNSGIVIYDKAGDDLTGNISYENIFLNEACCDLTVSYDNAADRWIITILSSIMAGNSTSEIQIAVSQGPDPINDGWYNYTFPMETDYQKLSIWSDGYYLTGNKDGTSSTSPRNNEVIFALERSKMLQGYTSAQIIGFPLTGITIGGFYSPQALNVTNANLPANGGATFVYLQDDAWDGISQDHIKLWTVDVDWQTPENSEISAAQQIITTPFISVFDGGDFSNLAQPDGQDLDVIQATIMNQAQFRKFDNHNSAIFNFVVDTDATAGKLAGIRWMELRQGGDNQPWTLYQEGTYTAPGGRHAWLASMAMDSQGNIGMGYSSMSGPTTPSTVRVGSYYTGRYAADPLGTMTIAEEIIATSNSDITGAYRFGDYSKIDVNPNDDNTFWFVTEYNKTSRKNVVGVFKIAAELTNDVGVLSIDTPVSEGSFGTNEDIVVTFFNYGTNVQSDIPIKLSVNGTEVATGTLSGSLASSTSVQYTFTGVDLSIAGTDYIIEACTILIGDELSSNNCRNKLVKHLLLNDIGVSQIVSPVSESGLTNTESVTVTIRNYGSASQSNFNIMYSIDSGMPIIETVTGILAGNSSINYTFTQTVDVSTIDTSYNLSVMTLLLDDEDMLNDELSSVINNFKCHAMNECFSVGTVGMIQVQLGAINNSSPSECLSNGNYSDFTDLTTDLAQNSTNELIITTDFEKQYLSVWVDFNDDYFFTADELLIDNDGIAVVTGLGYPAVNTKTISLSIPENAIVGSHTIRLRTFQGNSVIPQNNSCADVAIPGNLLRLGETEDYTVNITSNTASVSTNLFKNNFIVSYLDNNQFNISVNTSKVMGKLNFSVTNMLGQKLLSTNINNNGNGYSYDLDMSYATPGVYTIRLGNNTTGSTKKIIVK